MQVRKLQLRDAFKVGRFIKRANLQNAVMEGYKLKKAEGEDVEYLGINLMFDVMNGITDEESEKEFYALVGDVAQVEDAGSMDIDEIREFIDSVVKENDLSNFIKAVKNSMK